MATASQGQKQTDQTRIERGEIMHLRRFLFFTLAALLVAVSLSGCGDSQTGQRPPAKEPYSSQAPEQEPVKSSEKTSKPADGAEPDNLTAKGAIDFAKDYGEKDWLASAAFAEYIGDARADRTESWYHSLAAMPEIRKGAKGRVGIIVLDIQPSHKAKTKEVLRFYTEAALGCPDPKIAKVVILGKKGNVLVEKENK
ncbi:MAG: hypothetical protein AB1510_09120 [Bacillota bacterium]